MSGERIQPTKKSQVDRPSSEAIRSTDVLIQGVLGWPITWAAAPSCCILSCANADIFFIGNSDLCPAAVDLLSSGNGGSAAYQYYRDCCCYSRHFRFSEPSTANYICYCSVNRSHQRWDHPHISTPMLNVIYSSTGGCLHIIPRPRVQSKFSSPIWYRSDFRHLPVAEPFYMNIVASFGLSAYVNCNTSSTSPPPPAATIKTWECSAKLRPPVTTTTTTITNVIQHSIARIPPATEVHSLVSQS